jgi:AAA+ superfamily predicted ATPase
MRSLKNMYKNWSKKTFDDIFIDDKQLIIDQVMKYNDNPENKFNVLLHGLPGTSKTSIIQVISNMTKRNIMIIKLSEILDVDEIRELLLSDSVQAVIDGDGRNYRAKEGIYQVDC